MKLLTKPRMNKQQRTVLTEFAMHRKSHIVMLTTTQKKIIFLRLMLSTNQRQISTLNMLVVYGMDAIQAISSLVMLIGGLGEINIEVEAESHPSLQPSRKLHHSAGKKEKEKEKRTVNIFLMILHWYMC